VVNILNVLSSAFSNLLSTFAIFAVQGSGSLTLAETHLTMNYAPRGLIVIKLADDIHITVSSCVFQNNLADQGGAVFIDSPYKKTIANWDLNELRKTKLGIRRNVFLNNTAYLYGHTFASGVFALEWINSPKTFSGMSGEALPEFSVIPLDMFGEHIIPIGFDAIGLGASLQSNYSETFAQLLGPSQGFLLQNQRIFNFSKLTMVGNPGIYSLVVAPIVHYNPVNLSLFFNVTIIPCGYPYSLFKITNEELPRCVKSKHTRTLFIVHCPLYNQC
jgi:hypothetical protein